MVALRWAWFACIVGARAVVDGAGIETRQLTDVGSGSDLGSGDLGSGDADVGSGANDLGSGANELGSGDPAATLCDDVPSVDPAISGSQLILRIALNSQTCSSLPSLASILTSLCAEASAACSLLPEGDVFPPVVSGAQTQLRLRASAELRDALLAYYRETWYCPFCSTSLSPPTGVGSLLVPTHLYEINVTSGAATSLLVSESSPSPPPSPSLPPSSTPLQPPPGSPPTASPVAYAALLSVALSTTVPSEPTAVGSELRDEVAALIPSSELTVEVLSSCLVTPDLDPVLEAPCSLPSLRRQLEVAATVTYYIVNLGVRTAPGATPSSATEANAVLVLSTLMLTGLNGGTGLPAPAGFEIVWNASSIVTVDAATGNSVVVFPPAATAIVDVVAPPQPPSAPAIAPANNATGFEWWVVLLIALAASAFAFVVSCLVFLLLRRSNSRQPTKVAPNMSDVKHSTATSKTSMLYASAAGVLESPPISPQPQDGAARSERRRRRREGGGEADEDGDEDDRAAPLPSSPYKVPPSVSYIPPSNKRMGLNAKLSMASGTPTYVLPAVRPSPGDAASVASTPEPPRYVDLPPPNDAAFKGAPAASVPSTGPAPWLSDTELASYAHHQPRAEPTLAASTSAASLRVVTSPASIRSARSPARTPLSASAADLKQAREERRMQARRALGNVLDDDGGVGVVPGSPARATGAAFLVDASIGSSRCTAPDQPALDLTASSADAKPEEASGSAELRRAERAKAFNQSSPAADAVRDRRAKRAAQAAEVTRA